MTYKSTRRDKLAHWLCEFAMNKIATKEYRGFVRVVTRLGIAEANRLLGMEDTDEV